MQTFCEQIWLFKFISGKDVSPISCVPEDITSCYEDDTFLHICLNAFQTSNQNPKHPLEPKLKEQTYAFTAGNENGRICYAWNFQDGYNNNISTNQFPEIVDTEREEQSDWFSIVVVGKKNDDSNSSVFVPPKFYFEMFEEAKKEVGNIAKKARGAYPKVGPQGRLGMVHSFIQSWSLNINNSNIHNNNTTTTNTNTNTIIDSANNNVNFIINYPSSQKVTVNNDFSSQFFGGFNPASVFDPKKTNFTLLWKSLLTSSGVRIIADSNDLLSYAVFAACSLVSPFPYRDSILMTSSEYDPRLEHADRYSIVATTSNVSLKNIHSMFSIVLKADWTGIPSNVSLLTALTLQQRSKRLAELSLFAMDRTLFINPYSDMLNYPFVTDDLDEEMGHSSGNVGEFVADDLRKFEKTQTLQKWRKGRIFRDSFRSAFLSIKPDEALEGKSRQHLKIIYKKLSEMKNDKDGKFFADKHVQSVIKRHMKKVRSLLKASISSSSSADMLSDFFGDFDEATTSSESTCTLMSSSSSFADMADLDKEVRREELANAFTVSDSCLLSGKNSTNLMANAEMSSSNAF